MPFNPAFIALGVANPGLAPLASIASAGGTPGAADPADDRTTLGDIAVSSPRGAVAVLLAVTAFVVAVAALGFGAAALSMLAASHLHGWTMAGAIAAVWSAWTALAAVGVWRLLTR